MEEEDFKIAIEEFNKKISIINDLVLAAKDIKELDNDWEFTKKTLMEEISELEFTLNRLKSSQEEGKP